MSCRSRRVRAPETLKTWLVRHALLIVGGLVVETSGVGDAVTLAYSLASCGYRLDAIVAVVDAEAGTAPLTQAVALRQVGRGA